MFETRENPDFSWSNKRKETLDFCKRAYYYNYYGAHNGWQNGASEENAEVYFLKNARSLRVAFANGMQNAITMFFANPNGDFTVDKFEKIIRDNVHVSCVKASNMERSKSSPKKFPAMIELLNYEGGYKNPRVLQTIDELYGKFRTVAENFFISDSAEEVMSGAEIIENFEGFSYGSFTMDVMGKPMTIWGKTDTVHKVGDKWIATLWKIGSAKKNLTAEKFHANVVAIYLCKRYRLKASAIEIRFCDLGDGETRRYELESKEEYVKTLQDMAKSIVDMSALTEGNDIVQNKALDKESFPLRENYNSCQKCQFYGLCAGNIEQRREIDRKKYEEECARREREEGKTAEESIGVGGLVPTIQKGKNNTTMVA